MYQQEHFPDISFTLNIPLKSKARPRFANGHAYLPKDYREWKKDCSECIKAEFLKRDYKTVSRASHISISFSGHARHDLDNLVGAVLDAGLPHSSWSGAWIDDRVSVFPSLCADFKRDAQESIVVNIWI